MNRIKPRNRKRDWRTDKPIGGKAKHIMGEVGPYLLRGNQTPMWMRKRKNRARNKVARLSRRKNR